MTLNSVVAVILRYFTEFESFLGPYFLQQKCSPKTVLAIFAEVTENECIIKSICVIYIELLIHC